MRVRANSAIGLDYFGARYFSAAQGRFTSIDPLNLPNLSNSGSDLRRHSRPRRPAGGATCHKAGRLENKELFAGQHLELANESFAEVGDCPTDRRLPNVPC